jgi:hypothetical protein
MTASILAVGAGYLLQTGFEILSTLLWPKLTRFLNVWWLPLIGTFLIVVTGFGLFIFRKYYQKWYGLAEIVFASAIGWSSVIRIRSTDIASWTAVLAAAYLVVRGLTNYDEGKKKELATI